MNQSTTRVFEQIEALRRSGEDFCVVTVVRTAAATSAKAGAKAVVTRDGTIHGHVGGGCVTGAMKRVGREVIASGEPRMIRVRPTEDVVEPVDVDGVELHKSSCPSGGTVDLFFEPMRQGSRLVVCGATAVAETLLKLGTAMGLRTVSVALPDDREKVGHGDTDLDSLDLEPLGLGPRDAIVVATQGKRDREALGNALRSEAGYVGMVGSRRKIRLLLDQLGPEISPEQAERLHGPAGLDLGAIAPEEIALSILSQIVQEHRQSAGQPQPSATDDFATADGS